DLMTVEQEDIIPNDYAGNMGYLIFIQPATTPKFERNPDSKRDQAILSVKPDSYRCKGDAEKQ
ncbi:hypothetical protein MJI95_32040, partial [Salmonella enterica subsp. enterica serovar Kentucky]|nr:hypothetical protein [Salmonella enterica subsp. enterica serovar Kentucky]